MAKRRMRRLTDDALTTALHARAMAEGQRPLPTATARQIRAAERAIGFPLPATLALVLTQVGNGGFGPEYGLMGVEGGAVSGEGDTLVTDYLDRRKHVPDTTGWEWPMGLLPICEYGCNVYYCVAPGPREALIRFDPNEYEEGKSYAACLFPERTTLRAWLTRWAQGV